MSTFACLQVQVFHLCVWLQLELLRRPQMSSEDVKKAQKLPYIRHRAGGTDFWFETLVWLSKVV